LRLFPWHRRPGSHRFEAAKKLKRKTISCTVFDDMETDEASW
jgi:ParB-like chromosome segregation protein Spo0J